MYSGAQTEHPDFLYATASARCSEKKTRCSAARGPCVLSKDSLNSVLQDQAGLTARVVYNGAIKNMQLVNAEGLYGKPITPFSCRQHGTKNMHQSGSSRQTSCSNEANSLTVDPCSNVNWNGASNSVQGQNLITAMPSNIACLLRNRW